MHVCQPFMNDIIDAGTCNNKRMRLSRKGWKEPSLHVSYPDLEVTQQVQSSAEIEQTEENIACKGCFISVKFNRN